MMADNFLHVLHDIRERFEGQVNTEELMACGSEIIPLKQDEYKIITIKGTPNRFKIEIGCMLNCKDNH